MLVFCQLTDPIRLSENHRDSFSADLKRQVETEVREIGIAQCITNVYNKCLVLLENVVPSMSKRHFSSLAFPSRPVN